ncbi:FxsA family protein [Methylocaldum sp. MU1018]
MNIGQWLLLALLGLPILEIYLLIKLIGSLGFFPTLLLLLGAAALGTFLLRIQGWTTWFRVQQALARGELPAREIIEGGLVAAGGVLLLIPGFISDLLALFCLLPVTRKRIAQRILESSVARSAEKTARETRYTIEGEFRRED